MIQFSHCILIKFAKPSLVSVKDLNLWEIMWPASDGFPLLRTILER